MIAATNGDKLPVIANPKPVRLYISEMPKLATIIRNADLLKSTSVARFLSDADSAMASRWGK